MLKCLDCGNTENFRVLFHDWSLLRKEDDSNLYSVIESLSYVEACDPAHPMECHECDSPNIEEKQ